MLYTLGEVVSLAMLIAAVFVIGGAITGAF